METCDWCDGQMTVGHTLHLDGRRIWLLCCLCAAEITMKLDTHIAEVT